MSTVLVPENLLIKAEVNLDLSPADTARFFGYSKPNWYKIRERKAPMPARMKYSIEAHLRLSQKTIDQLKKERLK